MITRWVDYRLRVFYKLDVIFIAWKSANLVKTIVIFLNTVDFERLITEAPGCSLGVRLGSAGPLDVYRYDTKFLCELAADDGWVTMGLDRIEISGN